MANFKPVKKIREEKLVSKKIGLVAMLVVLLVATFTTGVLAAQNMINDNKANTNDYVPTPQAFNDGSATGNNSNNYPNGIYLPNASNPAAYRIHSNYTATTDACASCHATHTAVGTSLLQWGTVYDTCMACHDGTITTTYNVVKGNIGATDDPTYAGAFGTLDDSKSHSGSNHDVTGSMSIYAAPGGYGSTGKAAELNVGLYGQQQSWDVEFGCESCHNPHGQGGNARLLNPDVNGVGWAKYNDKTTKAVALVDSKNGYYVTKAISTSTTGDTWILGYPYSDVTKVYAGTTTLKTTQYTLDNNDGFTKITITDSSVTGTLTADFVPSLVVKMNISNYLNNGGKESVTPVSGMNAFCGACHTDYNTNGDGTTSGSGHTLTGQFAQAYRHQVGMDGSEFTKQLAGKNMVLESDKVTCETCHFAHGTNQDFWKRTAGDPYNVAELAGSSALKRLPNMGTCEACHEKGYGNEGYTVNSGSAVAVSTNPKDFVPGGQFVGQAACENCHADKSEHYAETWHPSISRPGLTQKAYDAAVKATDLDTIVKVPGFQAAVISSQTELNKVGFNKENGRLSLDPRDWKDKKVTADNVKVWSTGTDSGQEVMVRGTVLGSGYVADKWYIIATFDGTAWQGTGTEPEDYGCGTRGCHSTGYVKGQNGLTGASSDFTLWLNAAAAGTKVPFELGVTCEACHGAGGNHAKAPSAKNIVNPAKFTPNEQSVGNGGIVKFNPVYKTNPDGSFILDASGNKIQDSYTNGTLKVALDSSVMYLDNASQAKSCGACHNGHHQPEFYMNTYNADGTVKTSPTTHFTKGVVSCVTCHNSHEESVDPAQLSQPTAEKLCNTCHGNVSDISNLNKYMPLLDSYRRNHGVTGTQHFTLPAPVIPTRKY